ncbi:hypothetical protein ACWKW1_25405 [Brevibacillus parabrevis]
MRWVDWLIVSLLVVIGLSCLTMSATWMMGSDSIGMYFHNFFKICLWSGIPILVASVLYVIAKKRGKKDD